MTYSIWLVPSYGDKKYLNKIINDLAKKHGAPKFSAHITVYSGITSLRKAKAAVQSLDSCKIRVYKTGIGQSDYLWKTIFVKIKNDKNLGKIHKTLHAKLGTKYDFAPHISLIYKKMDHSIKRKTRNSLKIKKSFSFGGIAIVRSSKRVKDWKVIYKASLGAA
jgi:2'-5' RNA ligase